MSALTRKTTITADDSRGYWVVIADGDAGTWIAVDRSLERATGYVAYAAMIGEFPVADWNVESVDDVAPYVIGYMGGYGGLREQDATALYLARENILRAHHQGTMVRQAPMCPDAFLSNDDYAGLDDGAILYPAGIGDGCAVVADTDGYAYVVREGVTYTFSDGSNLTIVPNNPVHYISA